MANSPESSVLRNLAIALGDGLAFGVGLKLTQTAARQPAPPRPEAGPLLERVAELERRLEETRLALARPAAALDRQALEALARTIVGQVETRLQEEAARTAQRLTDIQESYRELAGEFHQRFQEESEALEQRLQAVHAELSETLPRAVHTAVERRIEDLRAQLAQRDAAVTEVLEAIGRAVQAATERLSPPPAPSEPSPVQPAAQSGEDQLPAFLRPATPQKLWRAPLVSCFVVACGALAILHYL